MYHTWIMSTIYDDGPLPLSKLKRWMPDDVFSWLEEGDEKAAKLKKDLEANSALNVANLFGSESDSEGDDDEESAKNRRVQSWASSSKHVDGIGGFDSLREKDNVDDDKCEDEIDEHSVNIVYILSESYQGFGDTLWSSARHMANVLANPEKCGEVLSPLLSRRGGEQGGELNEENSNRSPLHGMSFLEVGAGAGLPSWTAMRCGARVVCTDLSDTNRIRSMGECAERNWQLMEADGNLLHGNDARVCPHDWGTPVDGVVKALNKNGTERFDLIIAADCCYMPWLHAELLDSIHNLLSDIGVALIAFALHGNTDDDDVWKIVDRAKEKGFIVEVLESQQLTPPTSTMESKQGLVHTIRITK